VPFCRAREHAAIRCEQQKPCLGKSVGCGFVALPLIRAEHEKTCPHVLLMPRLRELIGQVAEKDTLIAAQKDQIASLTAAAAAAEQKASRQVEEHKAALAKEKQALGTATAAVKTLKAQVLKLTSEAERNLIQHQGSLADLRVQLRTKTDAAESRALDLQFQLLKQSSLLEDERSRHFTQTASLHKQIETLSRLQALSPRRPVRPSSASPAPPARAPFSAVSAGPPRSRVVLDLADDSDVVEVLSKSEKEQTNDSSGSGDKKSEDAADKTSEDAADPEKDSDEEKIEERKDKVGVKVEGHLPPSSEDSKSDHGSRGAKESPKRGAEEKEEAGKAKEKEHAGLNSERAHSSSEDIANISEELEAVSKRLRFGAFRTTGAASELARRRKVLRQLYFRKKGRMWQPDDSDSS
jgi:hypothetical protein